ncbi:N utilization substance protein B [Candidatus Rickettsiella isopodorum]|jgi:N utilization substance protein B|uniref:Transcription antitermination protein NusB n=1 Tax=Candidatus Rickettsiella isopodorum TaxID=1225476 RepID=A0A1J8P9B7_9COXI|nr:transcription antitermination factor NusB [Candidatus Rickettsiella isopodorum]OIZ95619.1 N utilization substance protein B [Candidatus Rickettsiella isopodorum]
MTLKSKKNNFKSKQRARRFAMQAIYQWHLTQENFSAIQAKFLAQEEMVSVDTAYFVLLVQGVLKEQASLDSHLQQCLDRPLKELDLVELAILRLGAYELLECAEVPYKVALNESIELAKMFGATDSYKYINGILDLLAKKNRPLEYKD